MTTPEEVPSGPVETPSASTEATDPIGRAVDFAIYAPIGTAALFADVAPELLRTVVARGRAEVEVRHEQVTGRIRHAKGAGEVAVAFGLPMLRRKVEERIASLRPTPPPAPEPRPAPRTPAASRPPRTVSITPEPTVPTAPAMPGVPVATANGNGRGEPDTLAIPGYDALSASQVVERLAGLSRDELAAVREYETGHRRRRTILGKIEQLSA
jgi:hypothetical protein